MQEANMADHWCRGFQQDRVGRTIVDIRVSDRLQRPWGNKSRVITKHCPEPLPTPSGGNF